MLRKSPLLLALLFIAACSGGASNSGADAMPGGDGDGDGDGDAGNGGDWSTLIDGTWSRTTGTEGYWCTWLTVTEDTYVTEFSAISPEGTHHMVVSMDTSTVADGEQSCFVGTNHERMLFASGVGTEDYSLPDGVAIKVPAGQQLLLNIHTFNAGDANMVDVVSGVRIKTVPEAEVVHMAEMVFAGSITFPAIEDNGTDIDASGSCTFDQEGHVFALWPHMHQIGKHMVVRHNDEVIHDEPFRFEEQVAYPLAPMRTFQAGDTLNVTCTWNNPPGNGAVGFGDSSEKEMCFVGFYRYPATEANLFCDLPIIF